jgi:predicted neuraminidase
MRRKFIPLLVLASFALGFYRAADLPPATGFSVEKVEGPPAAAHFESHFVTSKLHTQVHAASAIELKDGRIRAFWFSGSREGAADVTVHSAVFDPKTDAWGAEQVVVGREDTQQALHRYISKVGNPVPARAPDGSLWLFYVTVSLGGWAGSSISLMTSNDEGETWSEPRKLVTSPFMNISTLVKGTPFYYADGTLGLPVYHEFLSKFAEVLRLDGNGRLIDKQRMAAGGQGTLQPVLLVQDADHATALTRYSGDEQPHRAKQIVTEDGGRHWSGAQPTTLDNPDAALGALVMPDGRWLAVLNRQQSGRDSLSLVVSADRGASWREVVIEDQRGQHLNDAACLQRSGQMIAASDAKVAASGKLAEYVDSARAKVLDGACHFEFSYPYLIQAANGEYHLVYTWNRVFIKHLAFDQGWLDQRLQEAQP